jgi:hypothetical protein
VLLLVWFLVWREGRIMARMKWIPIAIMGAIFPIFIVTMLPHQMALGDPKHCNGYNECYDIGYRNGFNDAQSGTSPTYACIGHSSSWCDGYNFGFRAGNGGSNIFYGQRSDQGDNVFVFFQLCSICYEPVIGFKEGNKDKQWFDPTDTKDLIILKQG